MSIPQSAIDYQMAHLSENQSPELAAFFIICMILVAVFVTARVVSRLMANIGLESDDYTVIVGALIAEGSFIVLVIYAFGARLGQHWVALSLDQTKLFAKLNFAYNILNVACYPIIKISILLLYNRIFIIPKFQRVVWGAIAVITMILISQVATAVFACNPIRGFWDFTVKSVCINEVQFYWATAVLNVVTDVFILILPLPMLWRLQMPKAEKIALTCLFVLGGFCCAISIIRIVYYTRFDATDPSWTFIGDAYSTPGEVTLAVICACFPTIRPLSVGVDNLSRTVFKFVNSRISSITSFFSKDSNKTHPPTSSQGSLELEFPMGSKGVSKAEASAAPRNDYEKLGLVEGGEVLEVPEGGIGVQRVAIVTTS